MKTPGTPSSDEAIEAVDTEGSEARYSEDLQYTLDEMADPSLSIPAPRTRP